MCCVTTSMVSVLNDLQLLGVVNDFTIALNSGKQIDALFLDFSKAFDKVPHERLYPKLLHCGNSLNWIKSFLQG